jgi:hypothetical protein
MDDERTSGVAETAAVSGRDVTTGRVFYLLANGRFTMRESRKS